MVSNDTLLTVRIYHGYRTEMPFFPGKILFKFLRTFMAELRPNRNQACFVRYLKLSTLFFLIILKQIVWETKKMTLKRHWTSINFIFLSLILWRILNWADTKIFSWFCHCIFLLCMRYFVNSIIFRVTG